MAFDINLGCSGYVYGMAVISNLMNLPDFNKGLLLCGDKSSFAPIYTDKSVYPLFGDAGAATLLSSIEDFGVGQFVFGTDGSRSDYLIIRDGGGRNLINENSFIEEINEYGNVTCRANFYMNGTGVFLFGMKTVPKLIDNI